MLVLVPQVQVPKTLSELTWLVSRLLEGKVMSDWFLYPFESPNPGPHSKHIAAKTFLPNAHILTLSFPAGKAHVESNGGHDAVCGEPEEDV